jgi:hypothetical protein
VSAAPDPWAFQRWAIEQAVESNLSATAAHVLLLLAVRASSATGYVEHTSVDWIAEMVCRKPRQVAEALADLVGAGLIERRRRGRNRPAATRLLAPWIMTCGQPQLFEPRPAVGRRSGPAAGRTSGSAVGRSQYVQKYDQNDSPPQPPARGGSDRQPELGVRGSGLRTTRAPKAVDLFAPPPLHANGTRRGRARLHDGWDAEVAAFAREHYPEQAHRDIGVVCRAVAQAIRHGHATTPEQVHDHIREWFIEPARKQREASSA